MVRSADKIQKSHAGVGRGMSAPSNFGFCLSSLGLAATCYFRESQTARALDPYSVGY
jgi:hypothetical protein